MYDIIVFSSFYKPHIGGVEKYVENIYKRLNNKKILIVTSKYEKKLAQEDFDENIEIIRINSIEIIKGKYYIPTFREFLNISKLFRKHKHVQIHTHTRFYFTNFLVSLLVRKNKHILYHFEHGSSFVKDDSYIVKFFSYVFDLTFGKYLLKKANMIFPVSDAVRTFLNKNYGDLNIGPTIYNSFNFENKIFKEIKKPNVLKLLFVGRLVKSKGIFELLEALNSLNEINWKLTLIGDGSERESIEKYIIQNEMVNMVSLRGPLTYEQTQEEYPLHHILINPSYTEGLPTTVLEALGNNLFVIATNVGGTNEIIKEEMLINKDEINPEQIKIFILKTYKDWEKLNSYYKSIYPNILENFTWENNIKTLEKHI